MFKMIMQLTLLDLCMSYDAMKINICYNLVCLLTISRPVQKNRLSVLDTRKHDINHLGLSQQHRDACIKSINLKWFNSSSY